MTSRVALCLLAALLIAPVAKAQVDIDLSEATSGRGRLLRGPGGLAGFPQSPVEGLIGASQALVDLNGDGADELVVGAPGMPTNPGSGLLDGAGRVYIVFGSADAGQFSAPSDIDLSAPVGVTVVELLGEPGEDLGTSVAAAGDVDGDGFEDLIVGAPGRTRPSLGQAGAAYILFGDANLAATLPASATFDSLVPSTSATRLLGSDDSGRVGSSVGGDVRMNADALSEVVLGAPLASSNGRLQNGTAWVVYGSAGLPASADVDLGGLGVGAVTRVTGALDFQLLGQSVAGLGRFDARLPSGGVDTVEGDDVALGAPGFSGNGLFSGAVFVLRGDSLAAPALSYTTADFGGSGNAGILVEGKAAGDQLGLFVGSAGDLFPDGGGVNSFVELLAGAPFADGTGSTDAGAMLVVAGRLGGLDPVDVDAAALNNASNLRAVAIYGPQNSGGAVGISGASFGDFDDDGDADLAVGFPGFDRSFQGLKSNAGVVEVLDGGDLQPPAVQVVDLQFNSSSVVSRLLGDASGARAGSALVAGDHDGDGFVDLGVGLPGAPSDPGSFGLSRTGRGQLVFGELARVASLEPTSSFLGGPVVSIEIFDLPAGPVSVTVGGKAATVVSVVPGDLGVVAFEVPSPTVPGSTVDISVDSPIGIAVVSGVFTYTPFALTAEPSPSTVVPNFPVSLAADAVPPVPPLANLIITVGGLPAQLLGADSEKGEINFLSPAGLAPNASYDVVVNTPNGSDTLVNGLSYAPFVVVDVDPSSGPQESGISIPEGTPGFGETGVPALPLQLVVPVSLGTEIAPTTTIEFGSDELGWKFAEITAVTGVLVDVLLPDFLLGPEDVLVDVRLTDGPDVAVFEDVFTYTASDYREILDPDVSSIGFGAQPPELRLAGDFSPGANQLILLSEMAPETVFIAFFGGLAESIPAQPFRGGLIGVDFAPPFGFLKIAPVGGQMEIPLEGFLDFSLGPAGVQVYLQLVTQEFDGGVFDYGFSTVIEATLRIP